MQTKSCKYDKNFMCSFLKCLTIQFQFYFSKICADEMLFEFLLQILFLNHKVSFLYFMVLKFNKNNK